MTSFEGVTSVPEAKGLSYFDPRTFVKGHGTGNDFVLLPDLTGTFELTAELAIALCDRRTGLGADGVLRVAPAPDGDGWFMDHRNADGSTAEMCGNGIRVFGRWLVRAGVVAPGPQRILTRGGYRNVEVPPGGGDVSVDMGPPILDGVAREVTVHGQSPQPGISVDMGNPHVVTVAAAELADLDLTVLPIATPAFPHGVNVEIITMTGPRSISMRVHERGVGETQSCGTGACAAAVAAAQLAGVSGDWEWNVHVPGGDLLVRSQNGTLVMTGPAVLLAKGTVELHGLTGHSGTPHDVPA